MTEPNLFTNSALTEIDEDLSVLRQRLLSAPLWKRAQILAEIAIETGLPLYEIEKGINESK